MIMTAGMQPMDTAGSLSKGCRASSEGISVYKHCPKNKVAIAYQNLTKEVFKHEN